jgi:hypothetical protein
MRESKLRFKVGDRVIVAKYGLGTIKEIKEFWMREGRYPEPSKHPYTVVVDERPYASNLESVRMMGMLCREDELTQARSKPAKAGTR